MIADTGAIKAALLAVRTCETDKSQCRVAGVSQSGNEEPQEGGPGRRKPE